MATGSETGSAGCSLPVSISLSLALFPQADKALSEKGNLFSRK